MIYDSKMFQNKRTGEQDDNKCRDAVNELKIIFQKPHLVNVFQLDSDETSHDIELAILKVFLIGKIFLKIVFKKKKKKKFIFFIIFQLKKKIIMKI